MDDLTKLVGVYIACLILASIGAVYIVVEYWSILLGGIIGVLLAMFLVEKWPFQTYGICLIIIFVIILYAKIDSLKTINDNPVVIYRTTDSCVIYDLDNQEIVIGADVVIAKMTSKTERVNARVNGVYDEKYKRIVYVYEKGEVKTYETSIYRERNAEKNSKFDSVNIWNVEELERTTFGKFKKQKWWEGRNIA